MDWGWTSFLLGIRRIQKTPRYPSGGQVGILLVYLGLISMLGCLSVGAIMRSYAIVKHTFKNYALIYLIFLIFWSKQLEKQVFKHSELNFHLTRKYTQCNAIYTPSLNESWSLYPTYQILFNGKWTMHKKKSRTCDSVEKIFNSNLFMNL